MDQKKRAQSPCKAAPEDQTTRPNSSTDRPIYHPLTWRDMAPVEAAKASNRGQQ